MSNQYDGALRAAILAAVKKPNGTLTKEIAGWSVPQVGRMVQKLTTAGLVFRAPVGGKYGRYFDSMARAEAYAAAVLPTAPVVTVKVSKGPAHLPGEPFVPHKVKPVEGVAFPENRWISGEVPSIFRAVPYGDSLKEAA